MPASAPEAVVLYDGTCAFCRRSMRILARLDARQQLTLAPRESERGQAIAARHPGLSGQGTIVLVKMAAGQRDCVFTHSTAVLEALALTHGEVGLLARAAMLIPRWMRDLVYRFIARYRHRFSRCD